MHMDTHTLSLGLTHEGHVCFGSARDGCEDMTLDHPTENVDDLGGGRREKWREGGNS